EIISSNPSSEVIDGLDHWCIFPLPSMASSPFNSDDVHVCSINCDINNHYKVFESRKNKKKLVWELYFALHDKKDGNHPFCRVCCDDFRCMASSNRVDGLWTDDHSYRMVSRNGPWRIV